VIRRMVPLTEHERRGCVHSARGDRSCGGERPGRPPVAAGSVAGQGCCGPGAPGHARGGHRRLAAFLLWSAGHLGLDEAGELAGDRGDGHGLRFAAGRHRLVLGVQVALRFPGAGQGARLRVVLPAAQRDADRGLEPVGPRGLPERCARVRSRLW
jgi:hypothetical protein